MKAVVLAAGYGTRLYPLTKDCPKTLLPVGGRPMVEWILERMAALPVSRAALVTNARFAPHHQRWLASAKPPFPLEIVDDGTRTEAARLGAVGDIRLGRDRLGTDEDLMVVAGDNLFEWDLRRMDAFFRGKGAPVLALKDLGDSPLRSKYGIVDLAADGCVVSFEEKPAKPRSALAATCVYLFPAASLALLDRYLASGGNPDAPGHYLQWLIHQTPVYGFPFSEAWLDIGDIDSYNQANARFISQARPGPSSSGTGSAR